MCSTIDDEERFIAMIDLELASSSNSLPKFKAWKQGTKDAKAKLARRLKAAKEAKEAEKYAEELGVAETLFKKTKGKGKAVGKGEDEDAEAGLRALIQGRQTQRMDSLIGSIEARYAAEESEKEEKKRSKAGGAEPGKRRKKEVVEPTEEEFDQIRAGVEARRRSNGIANGKQRK